MQTWFPITWKSFLSLGLLLRSDTHKIRLSQCFCTILTYAIFVLKLISNSCMLYISSVIMIIAFKMSCNHLLRAHFNHPFYKNVEIDFSKGTTALEWKLDSIWNWAQSTSRCLSLIYQSQGWKAERPVSFLFVYFLAFFSCL